MQAINRLLSQNCNCYPHLFRCSTIKIHNFSSTSVETFCCLAFITFQYIVQFSRCNSLLRIESLFCFAKLQFLLLERSSSSTERRIICRAARAIESFSRFEARSQDPISWVLRSNGKIGTGGPEWARTTDLTIISRTLQPAELRARSSMRTSYRSLHCKRCNSLIPSHLLFESQTLRWFAIRVKREYELGGDSRDRTGDLLLARQALSQLSYIPVYLLRFCRACIL